MEFDCHRDASPRVHEREGVEMQESLFECVAVPEYPDKPRENSLTMVMDYGMGLASQRDLLETGGWFLDLAKIAAGVSRILPPETLRKKIQLYQASGVRTYPGGQFFELAFIQRRVEPYFEAVKRAGYDHVEISDNCIELPLESRVRCIRQALEMGLTVVGEVGKKGEESGTDELIRGVQVSLEAGAWKVLVEGRELVDQGLKETLLEALARAVHPDHLLFETPQQWSKGVSFHVQYEVWKRLLATFGPRVNIANVPPPELVRLCCLRLGIGADTTFEGGAFVLSTRGLLPRTEHSAD